KDQQDSRPFAACFSSALAAAIPNTAVFSISATSRTVSKNLKLFFIGKPPLNFRNSTETNSQRVFGC
ncbi:MAG: hypothetical protein IJT77_02385, partial [Clostridia bacterium]|nr:hypothetical protein [Clostridia bacterium]